MGYRIMHHIYSGFSINGVRRVQMLPAAELIFPTPKIAAEEADARAAVAVLPKSMKMMSSAIFIAGPGD